MTEIRVLSRSISVSPIHGRDRDRVRQNSELGHAPFRNTWLIRGLTYGSADRHVSDDNFVIQVKDIRKAVADCGNKQQVVGRKW